MAKNSIVIAGDASIDLSKVSMPESQLKIIDKSSQQIVACSSRLALVERDMSLVKDRIAKNPDSVMLKALKNQRKLLKNLHRDSVNRFNGIMEASLCEVKGDNLDEKYKRLQG